MPIIGSRLAATGLFAGFLVLLFPKPILAAGLPWEIWESPARLAVVDSDDLVVELSSHCPQGCRYDRSNAGPETPSDNPTPQRWLYRDGEEVVLFDERGPGALTRIWMTTGDGTSTCFDPSVRILFRVDGSATPVLDLSLAALFDGSELPFTPPLVADRFASSGGFVSRVPIAYTTSLRVSLIGADSGTTTCSGHDWRLLWYQFTAHRLPYGTAVASFTPQQDFSAWRSFLANRGDDPWHAMLAPTPVGGMLAAGDTLVLAARSGPGWLRGIRLHVPDEALATVHLRLRIDDELAVDMPLEDFFAVSAISQMPTRSLFFGRDTDGSLYTWWPMPYSNRASVELIADANLAATVNVDGSLIFAADAIPVESGRFRASLVEQCVPAGDIELMNEQGAGRIVGIAARYRADSVVARGYLEGDERVVLDQATAPTWYGTGVEDFYDAGFYFDRGEFSSALSGASEVDADGSGVTAAYRIMAADPIIYTSAVRWTQEAGFSPALAVPTCVRAVTYRYQRNRATTVRYDRFEVGDSVAASLHDYEPPADANCFMQAGLFPDEPPTQREAVDCRYGSGSSRFTLRVNEPGSFLRLRRTFDAAYGVPGTRWSAAPAEVWINGVISGSFPPAAPNFERRWQQQEILLRGPTAAGDIAIEITPLVETADDGFGESAWELRGAWVDRIFSDAFDDTGEGNKAQ